MTVSRFLPALFLFCMAALSCHQEDYVVGISEVPDDIQIPYGFPDPQIPSDNGFTKERWILGKKLFYDKRLSADTSISCGSCHKPSLAFADNSPTSPGIQGRQGFRNVPSLANVAYQPYFLREGSVPTLEMQVLVPVSEHNEFGFNMALLVDRLKEDIEYQQLAERAYQRPLDAFVITRAIANFQRSILSGSSRYDHYLKGNNNVLNSTEKEGMQLFFSSRTQCSTCHGGFNFTNYNFANNGLYSIYNDPGRYRLTKKETDLAMFKVPGLRNLGYTPPYMHDGSLATIEDVIKHYNTGGQNHPNKSNLIKPLELTEKEISALKSFLLTLNDEELINNPELR